MTTDLVLTWLHHPFTLGMVGLGAMAFHLLSEIILRRLAEMGDVQFQGVIEDHPRMLPTSANEDLQLSSLLGVVRWLQVADIGLLWLVIWSTPATSSLQPLIASLLLPAVIVVLAQRLARNVSETAVAFFLRIIRPLTTPLIYLVLRSDANGAAAVVDEEEEEASDREIQAFLEVGHAAGIIEGEEGLLLESLVEFFDTVVREVMTPRTDMVALADDVDFDTLLETFASSHKSRIPIYNSTIDRIVGVIHVKNLVTDLRRGDQPDASALMHDCLVVPESKHLGELLNDFQREHQQMAIVVDEYGGTSGLVTLEDILEEIVGEIQDELDPKLEPEFQEIEPGVYLLLGKASVELLEELFEVEVDEEEIETVGGLVFDRHGTVPDPGTVIDDDTTGLSFAVEEMHERRVISVKVRRLKEKK